MDVETQFPILERGINGRKIVYLDNAATMQVPMTVLRTVQQRVFTKNANVHRGIHQLSEESTESYEGVRKFVANYLNVSKKEIVFTSGTTHSINLVAAAMDRKLKQGDEIAVSAMEHHSNYIPWQQICKRNNGKFQVVGLENNGDLDYEDLERKLTPQTRLLAVTQCSNVLGTVNDIARICEIAHRKKIPVLVDGAQGMAHSHADLKKMGCDYYCFSAHKLMGLTGTGVLYAREELMRELTPFQFGGGMVKEVSDTDAEFETFPYCLEAGTPNFVGATALEAALAYRIELGEMNNFNKEQKLLEAAEQKLRGMERIHILGQPKERWGCLSFVVEHAHPYDVAALLDKKGIAVRSGHHCAMPLLKSLGVEHAVRISPAFYNTQEEIDYFVKSLKEILTIL